MATAEVKGDICRVCGVFIPSHGPFLEWSVRGCWPPFCSLECYDHFISLAAEDTQGARMSVSNKELLELAAR